MRNTEVVPVTFDDGVLIICRTVEISEPGTKPKVQLEPKDKYYFGFDNIGITRYYTAMQANQQISAVVNVPGWGDISTLDICVLEDWQQYKIVMRQPTTDENGLRITKLSLERIGEEYAFKD